MSENARHRFSEHVWVDESDHLRVEELDCLDLADVYGTPLFVISENQIRRNVERFQDAFRTKYPNTDVFFATKANYGLAVRRVFTDAGAGGDAFGVGELYICLAAGTDATNLVLNGSNKAAPELEMAIAVGVPIHVDDPDEMNLIAAAADRVGRPAQVSPRTRLMLERLDDVEADFPKGLKVGPGARLGNKFGMSFEDVESVCRRALQDDRFKLAGIHHHVGRWNHDLVVFDAVVREQVEWIAKLRDRLDGWTPDYVDFGGGMAARRPEGLGPVGNDADAPEIEEYAATIVGALRDELDRFGLPYPRLIIEPGRSLASNIGVLLGRVGVVKKWPNRRTWVSVDASQNLMPNILMMAYYYHAVAATKVLAPPIEPVDLVGPLCSFDFLGQQRPLPHLGRGDLIAFLDTGAYCESKSMQFNALPRAATVLVSGSQAEVVVERETLKDLIGRSRIPARLLPGSLRKTVRQVDKLTMPV